MTAPEDLTAFAQIKRWIIVAAIVVAAALMLRNIFAMARFAAIALNYPFDLDYGEGVVWQQARDIIAGRGYRPLGIYPAIVFHYPPVYHVMSLWLAWLSSSDELFAGRLLSIASTIATMGICACLAAMAIPSTVGRLTKSIAALAAPLIFITFPPVMMWFAFMRVDMLAGAFSIAGLLLAVSAVRRPSHVLVAAILFVLSIYTKQTSIAAPAAAFLMLLLLRPRLALVLFIACLALGLSALAWLSWISDGGFLRHILGFNLNRYASGNVTILTDVLRSHSLFFAMSAIGIWTSIRELGQSVKKFSTFAEWRVQHRSDVRIATIIASLLFFVLKCAMVPMILKSGASYNYLIEWLSSVAIFAAVGLVPAVMIATREAPPTRTFLAVMIWLLPLQALQPVGWDLTRRSADRQAELLRPLVALIHSASKPVISDDMILLIRAGKPVRWEPAIVAELSKSGRYDDTAFARLVHERKFAFFVTKARRGEPLFDDRYNPKIANAIYSAYPNTRDVAGLIVHLP